MAKRKQIEKALPDQRYLYTLERLIKSDAIFILVEGENRYAVSEFEDKKLVSFWPYEEIAERHAVESWEGFKPKKLTIEAMEIMLDVMEDNSWIMDIFPLNSKTGSLVTVEEFIEDLNKLYKSKG